MSEGPSAGEERQIDHEYLAILERKLKVLKDPRKATAKQVVSDIASRKEHQLSNLLSSAYSSEASPPVAGFDDNFVDLPLQPHPLRLKLAPQTCAISKQELLKLVQFDLNQRLHEQSESETQTEDKTKEMESEIEVIFQDFKPFDNASQLGFIEFGTVEPIKRVPFATSFHGDLLLIKEDKMIYLEELLEIDKTDEENSHELLHCTTAVWDTHTLIATLWTELNKFCIPIHCFAALFEINSNLDVKLLTKIEDDDLISQAAYSRIEACSKDSNAVLNWTIYPTSHLPLLYLLNEKGEIIEKQKREEEEENVIDGTVIRASSHGCWEAFGFDCGLISLTLNDEHTIPRINKCLKVSGAVSVLLLLPSYSSEQQACLLISSVIGPATIWKFVYEGEQLSASLQGTLQGSQSHDTVSCAISLGENLIAIGTYAGKILFYRLSASFDPIPFNCQIYTIYDAKLPVLALQENTCNELTVLTNNGIYQLSLASVDDS